ncbi:YheC/YheD family protein [Paenibacillus sp. IB182496]|uniref:YheC/YheD family protein n=1 Tax=Paenibacillus sabuli TaxID=2772509 RepID=A0A927BZJ3_9BACL|nr:YheC/YheD family protein [Paenibacillus sabuli]MBD2848259.1 YheC/YheD family protein [Paenibacillus sabuli]
MTQPVLGILTLYLNGKRTLEERAVYQRMITAGRALGLDVYVFTPQDVHDASGRIHALQYDPRSGRWSRSWRPFPMLIYDRCRIQRSQRFEQLKRFRAKYSHLQFLNRPMRNKWTVYQTLSKEKRFRPHLPHTRIVERTADIAEAARTYNLLYLKPINGTGGRGIARLEQRSGSTWLLQGRDHARRIIRPERVSAERMLSRLARWDLKGQRYIIQQGIELTLPSGRVHDYRMLVQKNGEGRWQLTGCAARIGAKGSVTSNLHGGGRAVQMRTLLKSWLDKEGSTAQVEERAAELGVQIAEHLEASYEALCELALDLAIDRNGHIWLLEVNPKPAREVFARAGEQATYRNALIRPLEYALWLYRQKDAKDAKADK